MKKTLLGLSIIAVLSSSVASAEGFYIGVSGGGTEADVSEADKAALAFVGVSVDEEDTGFKVFAGYRVDKYFALEAFYTDLGEVALTDGVDSLWIESDTFGLSALGIIPVTENFELFGKVGFHGWDADFSSTNGFSASDDGANETYGIGATYSMDQISFRAELERYNLDGQDVDMLSAGVVFNF